MSPKRAKAAKAANPADAEPVLRVQVRCKELPGRCFDDPYDRANPHKDPIHLAIQKGKEVVDVVSADREQATFVAEFRVGKKSDGSPNFLGPYAQGSADDRFFYLSWGVVTPTRGFAMFRRLKVRLGHLKWPALRRSIASGKPLTVDLRMTDAKGGPLCATPPATHIAWGEA